jgi:ribonucleoside-diphosphate reductase alpha chain
MIDGRKLLSELTIFDKYAKFLPEQNRREDWGEICDRYENLLVKRYPVVESEIRSNMISIRRKDVLMSMRFAQFAGPAIEKNNARGYNCCFLPIDDYRAFSEIMFLLLGGSGVGYSVQFSHVEKLPEIVKPTGTQRYLVGDSIEGWSDAVRHLVSSYIGKRVTKPRFDFSDIRPKGSRLVTAGGLAPGPEPLKRCLFEIEQILERKSNGEKLSTLDCHDIVCHIADAVLAGGIRRAACIALFSFDDEAMRLCKSGAWWELNPQRGRANNSAVVLRHRIKKKEFIEFWEVIKNSGSGEPGIIFSNDLHYGYNPCVEASLRPFTFCNLTEINGATIINREDFNERCIVASFFGTLQAGFTDFHYLRSIWKKNTEKDYLIGVGVTGVASNDWTNIDRKQGSELVVSTNKVMSKAIGTKPAARNTVMKPAGSTSCVLECSSGVGDWWDTHLVRRTQMTKDNPLYEYFMRTNPSLVKDYKALPNSAVIEFPIKAPDCATTRNDTTAIGLLERVKDWNINWIQPGFVRGSNGHNISATISIKPDEWDEVGQWMWKNREYYNGLSVLPYDGGTYVQAPFESITEEEYIRRASQINPINLKDIIEVEDNTTFKQELACSGGACEI